MAALDVLPNLPGGILLTAALVNVSLARSRGDSYAARMSLYVAFFGLVLILLTTGFSDYPRSGFFTLFCIGLGSLLGYLLTKNRRAQSSQSSTTQPIP